MPGSWSVTSATTAPSALAGGAEGRTLFTIGFGSPILAFLRVVVSQAIARKEAEELETRSKREETMRNLRWAAELAVNTDDRMSDLGVAELVALLESDLLDESGKVFIEAALDVVYQDPQAELDALGDDVEVVQLVADHTPTGRMVSSSVRKIANAKPVPAETSALMSGTNGVSTSLRPRG